MIKEFWIRKKISIIIFSINLIVTIILTYLVFADKISNPDCKDLAINLLAGFITLLFTTIFIDTLLNLKRKNDEDSLILNRFRVLKISIDKYVDFLNNLLEIDDDGKISKYENLSKIFEENLDLRFGLLNINYKILFDLETRLLDDIKEMISNCSFDSYGLLINHLSYAVYLFSDENAKRCFDIFESDEANCIWINRRRVKMPYVKQNIRSLLKYMDKNNIDETAVQFELYTPFILLKKSLIEKIEAIGNLTADFDKFKKPTPKHRKRK